MSWILIMSIIYLWMKALSAMSLRRPTVAILLKPFMWCRSDVRLWHALSFIFYYKPFMWCRLDARLQHSISTLWLHTHVSYKQPACVHHGFLFRDWRYDHRIFRSMIIICIIIPVFIMFASTFKVLTGLSLAIVLARFLAWSGATAKTAPEPKQRW